MTLCHILPREEVSGKYILVIEYFTVKTDIIGYHNCQIQQQQNFQIKNIRMKQWKKLISLIHTISVYKSNRNE